MSPSRRLDAIVIGGGPGGCVAAARLAEQGRDVVLLEAGPGEPRPPTVAGVNAVSAAEEQTRQWSGGTARTSAVADSHRYRYRQGFGLGGGSMINSLLLSPGDTADYRRWEAEHGCVGWGPESMAPWLDRAAAAFPASQLEAGPVSAAFARAAAAVGHTAGGTSLDGDKLGVLNACLAASGGRRVSAADAFLWPKGERGTPDCSSLTVETNQPVARILMNGENASGVVTIDGQEWTAPLVIVSIGAVRTPLLLAASGLTKRPAGRRFKDHPSFAFTLALANRGRDIDVANAELRAVSTMLRWSSGADRYGDLQAFVIDRVGAPASTTADGSRFAVVAVGLMQVDAVGSVGSASTGASLDAGGLPPALAPDIITGALGTDSDRRRLRAGVRHIAELLRSVELAPVVQEVLIDDQGTPVSDLDAMNDDELDRWIATNPGPYTHGAASCPLGPEADPNAIVSSEPEQFGLLHGYRGVYIVDASVLPDLVSGGLQLPIVAVAERILADLT